MSQGSKRETVVWWGVQAVGNGTAADVTQRQTASINLSVVNVGEETEEGEKEGQGAALGSHSQATAVQQARPEEQKKHTQKMEAQFRKSLETPKDPEKH